MLWRGPAGSMRPLGLRQIHSRTHERDLSEMQEASAVQSRAFPHSLQQSFAAMRSFEAIDCCFHLFSQKEAVVNMLCTGGRSGISSS